MKPFTTALTNNIERTFTYAHAKNMHNYRGSAESYEPLAFFMKLLKEKNPFKVFMELDDIAFLAARQRIISYGIPYTARQERQARVYYDITNRMQQERSDTVSEYVEDLEGTGIVLYKAPFILTTKETIDLHAALNALPASKRTNNILYEHLVSDTLKSSKEQFDALKRCLQNQVSVLIGGAGTGKSFVTASIIAQLQANRKKVAVLAPTHKAKEALQDKLDKKTMVQTIHSFVHNPTPCDAIVIDESGMLSTPLLEKLLRHHTKEQLVFVGDKNQIPPVEYGRPFERIQTMFALSQLKDNKRSEAADIIALGREILGIPQNANMRMPNIQVVHTSKEAFQQGAEVVLSYRNADVAEVNQEQRIKNGQKTLSPNFSVGDKIMAKTNVSGRFYNGQLFKITARNRAMNLKTGASITFTSQKDLEGNFILAYGLTIHKSQGSEWDVVAYQPSALDTQNLAYVAVTRAKKKLIIIGDDIKTEYRPDREWRQLV